MLQHRGQQIQIAGQRRDGLILGSVAAVKGVEGMGIVDTAQKQRAESGIAGIKVDQQHTVLHVRKLNGQIRGDRRSALTQHGGGHIEAVVILLCAKTIAENICRCGEILCRDRAADILLRHDRALVLVIIGVARDDADGLQTEDRLHVADVVEGGVHQQFDDREADAGRKAQQREQHHFVVAAADNADLFGLRLIDRGEGTELQGLRKNVTGAFNNGVPEGDALLRIAPYNLHLQNLRGVVLRHGDGVAQLRDAVTEQLVPVNDFAQDMIAANHVANRIHHILGQMEVVDVRHIIAADVFPVDVFGRDGKGAGNIEGLIGGLYHCHRRQNQSEGKPQKGKRNNDHPSLLKGKEQIAYTNPYPAALSFRFLQGSSPPVS